MLIGRAPRLTRVFLAYATTSTGRVASHCHSKDPWSFPNTLCLMVIKAGHSQSQWRRSCTSRRQFGQIESCDGSSRLRYCLREGWWPDRRKERRTSSFLLLICFVSRETVRCWYTKATRSCVAKASRIVSLINWTELDEETGKYVKICKSKIRKSKFILNSLDGSMLKTRQRKKRINFTKLT